MRREYRLRDEDDFKNLFRRGRRVDTPFFSFSVARNTVGHVRLGCIISKKTMKSAVLRNRFRRRVKEWFRVESQEMNSPIDIVVTIKRPAVELVRKAFYEELRKGTKKIIGK